jgi:ATP-binding cassette subfamily F protein 3
VSHDRDFLQGLTSTVYEFKDQKLKQYLGDIDFYLEQRQVENLREVEKRTQIKIPQKTAAPKQSYEEQKQLKSLNNRLSKAEASIANLERDIKRIDVEMELNYDQIVAKPGFFESYQAKKDKLDQLMSDWEGITESIEKLA